jgi:hypothetical protein
MFDEYTTDRLVELRSLWTVMIEEAEDIERRADALLLLERIDEELAIRDSKQAA